MNKGFHIQDIILFPLSLLFGIAVWVRNRLFDFKFLRSKEFEIPVISVGNITVGGTGKTPHVEYLIRLLKDESRVAMLSRGYKRKTTGYVFGTVNSSSDDIGDEPRQIKQKFSEITVAIDAKRVRGITKLLESEKGLEAVILDDAFQHRYVAAGLSIILVDYSFPLKNDFLLPYGRLREPASERARADIIIVTKCPAKIKPIDQRLLEKDLKMFAYQKIFFTTLNYGEPIPVFESFAKDISLAKIQSINPAVLLLTGIANPFPLKKHVNTFSNKIEELTYPDHYAYNASDLHELIVKFSSISQKDKIIITTEKDAMRLQHFTDLDEEIKAALYYIPIRIEFLENESKDFNHIITSYVRNNKPDNILHKPKNKKQA
jgi:tetraacyldisaccharide 4'-kinase